MTDTPQNPDVPDELGHRRRVASLGAEIADRLRDLVERGKEYRELGVPAREWLQVVGQNLSEKPARVLGWLSDYLAPAIDIGLGILDGKHLDDVAVEAFHAGGKLGAGRGADTEPDVTVIPPRSTVTLDTNAMSLTGARRFARDMASGGIVGDDDAAEVANLAQCYLGLESDLIFLAESPQTIRMRQLIERLFADAPVLAGQEDQRPAIEAQVVLRGMTSPLPGILSTTSEGTLRLGTPTRHEGKPVMIEQFFDYSDVVAVMVLRAVQAVGSAESRIITSS